jgi:hypothetical protein
MKTPRVSDFDPNTKTSALKSPLEHMPEIEKPKERQGKADVHANQQTGKHANQQTSLHANMQTNNGADQHSTKQKRKYSTYLTEESVLSIQMHAIQTKRKDHEIVQEAVDRYFETQK